MAKKWKTRTEAVSFDPHPGHKRAWRACHEQADDSACVGGVERVLLELISKPSMAVLLEAISHRRFRVFGKKQLILSRSSSLHLLRLRSFFRKYPESLDCDRILR